MAKILAIRKQNVTADVLMGTRPETQLQLESQCLRAVNKQWRKKPCLRVGDLQQ